MALAAALLFTLACSRSDQRLHVFISVSGKPDVGDHDYSRFLHEWKALLHERGAVADGATHFPTKSHLRKADVLVLYSDEQSTLSQEEQTRLQDFVDRGGGLVLLHHGIRAVNPEWAKNVAGGAWDSSGTKSRSGLMGLYFQDAHHPITEGMANFDIDDELSYRLSVAPGVHVLATSFQTPTELVPQIWTYEKTNHRTVVCLPGHRMSTLTLPQVRTLVLRSIAWAAKQQPDLLASKEDLAVLAYPPGGPASPDEAAKKIRLDADFRLSLVAAEPLIAKPIYLDWDAKGRMWVAIAPQRSGTTNSLLKNSILILEDSKGNGRMDTKHVFADGLDLVTSFVFHRDGVIVSQAPDILWLRDTDGDGVADKREVLFTGFGRQDSRSVINSFRWGLDGWVYGDQGAGNDSEKIVNGAGKAFTKIGNGIFRFKPDGSAIEMVSAFNGNSWGFDFAWDGELFFSKANGPHISHVMMPEQFLAHGRVPKATSDKSIEDHQKVFPLLADKRPEYAEAISQFTNASGCMIYQGGAWPRRYQNSAFVCEPTVHLLHEDLVAPVVEEAAGKSIGYEAIKAQKNEFLTANDLWFRPVGTLYGPDGAMYLLDFYSPTGFHTPASEQDPSVRPDQDYSHGRIWRIQHRIAQKLVIPQLADAPSTNLVKALEHPNAWVRMSAQRLLVERGDTNVTKALSLLIASNRVAAVRVHALWTLLGLHTLRETNLFLGIADPHPCVQKNALRALTERGLPMSTNLEKLVLKQSKEGADDRAKLNGLFALQQGHLNKETHQSILRHFSEQKDLWSKSAYLGIAMTAPMDFIKEALATDKGDHLKEAVSALADHLAETGSLSNAVYLVERMGRLGKKGGVSTLQGAILDSFTRGESPDFVPPWTPQLKEAFQSLLDSDSSTIRYNALALADRWDKENVLAEDAATARKRLLEDFRNHKKDEERNRIISVVMAIPSIHPEMIPLLEKFLNTNTPPPVVNHLVREFGKSSDKSVAPVLIKHFRLLNAEGKQLALSVLFKRPEWVSILIDSIADKEIRAKDLGVEAINRLVHYPDPALAKHATEVIESIQGPWQVKKDDLLAKFIPALAKPYDHKNGSEMFRQHCSICHRLGERDHDKDKTKDIGPELNSVGVYGAASLLTHIIDPNRVVETNYLAWNITTKKQEDFYGIIISENKETVKVRNILGDSEIRVSDIVSRKCSGSSLMPEGWETLGEKNLSDIVKYIIEKGPQGYRTLDLSSAYTADSRKGLFSDEHDKPSLELKKFGLLNIDSVPFVVANPDAIVDGKNLIVLKGGSGFAKTLPQRVEIPITSKAARIHILGGVAGWGFPNPSGGGTNDPLVRAEIIYADQETEEVFFRNGYEFADYVARIDVPGSRYVPDLVSDGQLRLFSFKPKRTNEIAKIVLESFDRPAAPTFVAMTAQLSEK